MLADEVLKDLLQLCADTQDGFWEAATNSTGECLPLLFQNFAVQWNEFGDKVFPILLTLNHTSPDARWKANPDRVWMNPVRENALLDDLAICMQCLLGLEMAQTRLSNAAGIQHPVAAEIISGQLNTSQEQAAAIEEYISGQQPGRVV